MTAAPLDDMTAHDRSRPPDALDLLIEQHEDVERLLEELEDDALPDRQKRVLFRALANNIAAHAAMEEQLFYPAVRAKQTEPILLESTEEHLAVKRVLADLMATEPGDPRFAARLGVLKHELEHHARLVEEAELFPKVRKLFRAGELQSLGQQMKLLFEELMTTEPMEQVPRQTRRPAEL